MRVNLWISTAAFALASGGPASAANLIVNGSFEGTTGTVPTGWLLNHDAPDGYDPVTIQYGQTGRYPYGAQGEAVPADDAASLSPDAAGGNGVYFVSDEAHDLSLQQWVYLTPGSYDIGFDTYDTYNGNNQPHDAFFTGTIIDTTLANFDLGDTQPGVWHSYSGVAKIVKAKNYLVSFTFNTPDTPANPDPANPNGEYNAKDVVIDRAYIIPDANGGGTEIPSDVPEPASWAMMICGFGMIGSVARRKIVRVGVA